MSESNGNPNIVVEITDAREFHCFRLRLNPERAVCKACGGSGYTIPEQGACETCHGQGELQGAGLEIMLHARSLVDLIHKCSEALCEWQYQTTLQLLGQAPVPTQELAAILMVAEAVAAQDWRTSVSEGEHFNRMAHMDRLRKALRETSRHRIMEKG